MSKAILIMDMPGRCYDCDLLAFDNDKEESFCGSSSGGGYLGNIHSKPDWCPLIDYPPHMKGKEYPDKITANDAYRKGLDDGWNALVDILDGVQTGNQET